MAGNNNNRKFQGAEDLEGIDLRNLVQTPENFLGSGAFGDVYYVKDKDGNERFSTGVVANNFGGVQILGGGDNNLDSSSGMNQEPAKKENLDQTVEDDDLPF